MITSIASLARNHFFSFVRYDIMLYSEPNGIPFGLQSEKKLSLRPYSFQCEKNQKYIYVYIVPITSIYFRKYIPYRFIFNVSMIDIMLQ